MTHRRRSRWWWPARFGGREDGSAAIELAVLGPGLLLILALIVAAGRVETAGGAVESAAHAAARAASLARTQPAAQSAARGAAAATLAEAHLSCSRLAVRVDTAGLSAPLGRPAQVRAAVTCRVGLSDLLVPGLPGSVTESGTFASAVDPYRGRG
jgi:Flp pilus assembly protein TadG